MNNLERAPQKNMKFTERLLRGIGGYTLGFMGVSLQATGLFSANPLAVAAGTGLAYLGHRVLDPYYDHIYGQPTRESSRLARFAKFNAALVPTYVGASLLGAAVFGGAGLNAVERVAVGAIGLPVMAAGNLIEQRLHTGEPFFNHEPSPEAVVIDPIEQIQPSGLFNRIRSAIHAFRNPQPAAV